MNDIQQDRTFQFHNKQYLITNLYGDKVRFRAVEDVYDVWELTQVSFASKMNNGEIVFGNT